MLVIVYCIFIFYLSFFSLFSFLAAKVLSFFVRLPAYLFFCMNVGLFIYLHDLLTAAEITVLCEDEYMTVVIAKSLLPGVDRGHLRLLDASCTASETSTHFSLTTPLTGCLTAVSHTPTSVICSNRVLEIPSDINDVVTRIKEVEISFSCQYFKSGVVSSVGWQPENNVIVFNDEGQRNFTMALNMFPDRDFVTPYSLNDFPVVVQIQQPLFFEVSATTGGLQVSLRADHCYATPTQDRNSLVKYDFIQDG